MVKCLEVLSSCAAVLASVQEKNILKEIAEAEEGRNRMKSTAAHYILYAVPIKVVDPYTLGPTLPTPFH